MAKKNEWKDGKQVETDEDNLINDTCPIWTKKPSDLKEEDYKKFYRDLYPMADEPLFWIHLNVDYPFNPDRCALLPEIKSNIDLQRKQDSVVLQPGICTDSVEGIVPDF